MQPRNRDGVRACPRNALQVNDRRIGRNRRDARPGLAIFQIQIDAHWVLEPAQILHLMRNNALRLLLIVRTTGKNFTPNAIGGPLDINAGINPHVFEVVARVARAFAVK